MKVELEFLDMSNTRVHEKERIYDNFGGPIPNVGELVCIEGYAYTVVRRDFMYLDNLGIDLKVSFYCEKLEK